MRYTVIATDGELTHREVNLDWAAVIGPEGKARVSMRPDLTIAAYVNDCGHFFPERYPRNIVGSCVLAALGARPAPYAGPIVFVGWNAANTPRGLIEIEPLVKVSAPTGSRTSTPTYAAPCPVTPRARCRRAGASRCGRSPSTPAPHPPPASRSGR